MPYCVSSEELDRSKHRIVGGPWPHACPDCAFPSSSSGEGFPSSSTSMFNSCVRVGGGPAFCVGVDGIVDGYHSVVSGPYFGDCPDCGSSWSGSSSSSSFSSSSSSSSSSSNSCGCRIPQKDCACLKIRTDQGILRLPKYLEIKSAVGETLCEPVNDTDINQYPECYVSPSIFKGFQDCFTLPEGCTPMKSINNAATFSAGDGPLTVWDSDRCDANGDPINPVFKTHDIKFKVGSTTFDGTITFSESGASIRWANYCCQDPYNFDTGAPSITITYYGLETKLYPQRAGFSWATRYRREYGDYTVDENQTLGISFAAAPGNGGQWFEGYNYETQVKFGTSPTCRAPDTARFCNCLDDGYNILSLGDLRRYNAGVKGPCFGRPIDIDVICGVPSGDDVAGGTPGTYKVFYTPFTNTVPVIDGVAYDTLNLPPAPAGKTNIVLLYTGSSRNDVRNWTCSHMKYATVKNPAAWNGLASSSSSSTDVSSQLNFNWPFNDLYFSDGCPGGENPVNLVPC